LRPGVDRSSASHGPGDILSGEGKTLLYIPHDFRFEHGTQLIQLSAMADSHPERTKCLEYVLQAGKVGLVFFDNRPHVLESLGSTAANTGDLRVHRCDA